MTRQAPIETLAVIPYARDEELRIERDARHDVFMRVWFLKAETWRPSGYQHIDLPARIQGQVADVLHAVRFKHTGEGAL